MSGQLSQPPSSPISQDGWEVLTNRLVLTYYLSVSQSVSLSVCLTELTTGVKEANNSKGMEVKFLEVRVYGLVDRALKPRRDLLGGDRS